MITEQSRYVGSALVELLKANNNGFTISAQEAPGAAAFLIDQNCLLLCKHSSARLSPWAFTFETKNVSTVRTQFQSKRVVFALICGTDGVVALTLDELWSMLPMNSERVAAINVSRKKGQHYRVSSGLIVADTIISGDDLIKKVTGTQKISMALRSYTWPMPPTETTK